MSELESFRYNIKVERISPLDHAFDLTFFGGGKLEANGAGVVNHHKVESKYWNQLANHNHFFSLKHKTADNQSKVVVFWLSPELENNVNSNIFGKIDDLFYILYICQPSTSFNEKLILYMCYIWHLNWPTREKSLLGDTEEHWYCKYCLGITFITVTFCLRTTIIYTFSGCFCVLPMDYLKLHVGRENTFLYDPSIRKHDKWRQSLTNRPVKV